MRGNLIVGQSGGPTAVINASLVGVVHEAMRQKTIDQVFGMRFGVEGLLAENIINLSNERPETLQALRKTPSSGLGASRHRLAEAELPKLLRILKKHDIRYVIMIGGNDSMSTIHQLTAYAAGTGHEIFGAGVPKTVDNDLFGTDHCPGYPSAARYTAISVRQAGILARDMQKVDPVMVYQTVGRNSGWLAAAAALARTSAGDPPHLIYMPERPFVPDQFRADVKKAYRRHGFVFIVCGEGVVYADGRAVSVPEPKVTDRFANIEFGSTAGASAARVLHQMATEHLGTRGEYQVPESLQMVGADRTSPLDLREAYRVGRAGVRAVLRGGGVMVTIERASNRPYRSAVGAIELEKPATGMKPMPDKFISADGHDVTAAFLTYLRPLVGDIPAYAALAGIGKKART